MKRLLKFTKHLYWFIPILLMLGACKSNADTISNKDLEANFVDPGTAAQTSVYWYWISDHISEEGVVKDLESMKEAGINRAFIGNIGLEDAGLEGGKVKFRSEEWWKILHTALKTATKLNIEIGMFNSPGWSQSGGPWVQPNQAMRYLASTKTQVTGGKKVEIDLAKPTGDFEDVKTIAYPVKLKEGMLLSSKNATITSIPLLPNLGNLLDGDRSTEVALNGNEARELVIDIKPTSSFTLRSVKIYTLEHSMHVPARIEVKQANGEFKTLSEFAIDRHNPALNVGFDPSAPIVISVPATELSEFRLVVSHVNSNMRIREIEVSSLPVIERYPEKTLAKMFQSPLPYWHEYQWKDQPEAGDASLVVEPSEVIDISQYLSGDRLAWDAPAGDWIVMRTGMKPTGTTNAPARPDATGFEIDKMSKKHIESHFEAYMGEVYSRIPAEDRKCWKVVVQDSYETGGQNFTDELLVQFKERYGYDALPFIPVFEGVVVQSEDVSNRFLWDLRRLVADKVAYDYVAGLREISHKHGLTTWLENYGHWGFPGEFLQYGGQSDEIGGEFWGEGDLGNIENRAASSCGHIYGKKKISAESFTTAGNLFGRHPNIVKRRGDLFFSEGINNTLLHVYVHQPYEDRNPGVNTWFGTEFNRKNTWFSHLDLFTVYLKRVNFMLQQGLNVADVAYFIGEDAPKMTGIADPTLPKGYQFDYINAEVIEKSLFVKDGLLTLPHGTQYKVLVLPKLETMRPELLQKIKQLIEDGATVLGPSPSRSPSLENYPVADAQVKELAASLWGAIDQSTKYAKIGKGLLVDGLDMKATLALIDCAPDFGIADADNVLYGHRTLDGGREVYFISNQGDKPITFNPEFRVSGLQPELWNPVSGTMRKLPSYTYTAAGTVVPMYLDVNESAFVVFRNKGETTANASVAANFPEFVKGAELKDWTLTFSEEQRGPKEPLKIGALEDLTKNADFDIQHYAGTLWYETSLNVEKKADEQTFINLNDVGVMAKVYVNGEYAGGVWTNPFRLDITEQVKNGDNSIKIEVVTTWVNRIIGDLKLPEEERKIWLTTNPWRATDGLHKAGLVGPVVIESIKY